MHKKENGQNAQGRCETTGKVLSLVGIPRVHKRATCYRRGDVNCEPAKPFAEETDPYVYVVTLSTTFTLATLCLWSTPGNSLESASMRHAPVSISFSTRDLLSFFSFRAHLLGGGTRPPERTRLNSAVRHQLGSRFVLPWGSTDESGGPGRDHSSIRARWLMRTASLSPHSGCPEPGEAGGPITYSAPLGGT